MAQLPNLPGFIRDKSGRLSVDKEATWIEDHDFSGDGYYGSDQDLLANAYMEYYERTNLPRGQLGGGNYIDRTYEQNDDGDDIASYKLRYEPPPPPAPAPAPQPAPPPAPAAPAPAPPPAPAPTLPPGQIYPVLPSTGQPPPGPPEVPRQPPQPAPAPQPAPLFQSTSPDYMNNPSLIPDNMYVSMNRGEEGQLRPIPAGFERTPGEYGIKPKAELTSPYEYKEAFTPSPTPLPGAQPMPGTLKKTSEPSPPMPEAFRGRREGMLTALEEYINPSTGETWTAGNMGGETPEGWVAKRFLDQYGLDEAMRRAAESRANVPAPAPLPDFKEQQGQQQAQQYPHIPPEFFSSPEYRNVPNIGGQAFTPTKYFGMYGNTTGTDMDAAFDQFLARTGTNYTGPVSDISERRLEALPGTAQQPAPQPPPATPRPTPAPPSEMEQKVVGETAAQAGIGTVPPVLDPQTQLTYTPQQPQQEEQFEPVTILDPLATTVEKASKTNLEIATPPRTNAQTYSAYVQEGTPEYAAAQGQPSSESLIGDIQGAVSQESIAQAAVGELDERATIRYQMDQLFDSFEEGKPPPAWAAPAVRKVGSMMAQRGLGKSSMAAAAITQAMMESGVQIAAQDANKYATIQLNNLNNQQKTALQNAMTFAAMDKANLDARMQAAVNNSRVFLQMDTANLTNQQQLKTIDLQQQYQKMFNDNAQENASRQFNAKSQMQVDQFFTELDTQVANANASRMAATEQFNADQANAATRYYSKLNDAREKLNVQLEAQISQANTVWRRQINTTNTAQQNFVNQQNALNLLGIQQSSMDKIWQRYRDEAQWALTVSENNAQRAHTAAILAQSNEFNAAQYEKESKDFMYTSMGGAVLKGVFGILGGGQTK